jgi:hypothetical protein
MKNFTRESSHSISTFQLTFTLCIMLFVYAGCSDSSRKAPDFMTGTFMDDYGIEYRISEEEWLQEPDARFHVVEWNRKDKYLIARNDTANPSEPGLYTRFDWMKFENMLPYTWGFCMTTYNANSVGEAKRVSAPNPENPKEGCNGFPFSRMQTISED